MSRDRVDSPDQLTAGDRVEVDGDGGAPFRLVVDLLWWRGVWWGTVAALPCGLVEVQDGRTGRWQRVRIGWLVMIRQSAFGGGLVFMRRRSREDAQGGRAIEAKR